MALINCPECTKEISDKVITCPHCGYPIREDIQEIAMPQQVEVTAVSIKANQKTKKLIVSVIVVFAVIIVAALAFNSYNKKQAEKEFIEIYNTYIDNLQLAQILMLSGGADAEELCNLTAQVWSNAIYEEMDSKTDKYTRPNGYGFVDDFNDALFNLYNDIDTMTIVSDIESNQDSVKKIIKDLQTPPDDLDKCYDTVTELYTAYKGLTDLAINPTGSFTSFTDSKSEKVSTFMDEFDKLSSQIPEKIEVES